MYWCVTAYADYMNAAWIKMHLIYHTESLIPQKTSNSQTFKKKMISKKHVNIIIIIFWELDVGPEKSLDYLFWIYIICLHLCIWNFSAMINHGILVHVNLHNFEKIWIHKKGQTWKHKPFIQT